MVAGQHPMKQRAEENYSAALSLLASHVNAAASRAYYALYQALVGEYEERNLRPEDFYTPRPGDEVKWPHKTVVRISEQHAGLDERQKSVAQTALELRIQADYKPDPVNKEDLGYIMPKLRDVLECLGVV